MYQSSNKRRLKFQIISKTALIRLAIFFAVLLILSAWGWFTMFAMPAQSYRGQFTALKPEEIALQALLKQDIQKIASEIGARNSGQYAKLNATKDFLEEAFTKAGYKPKSLEYKIQGKSYYNLEVEKIGTDKPQEIVVVGGHYDTAFTSIGANDNATGAAATLELARIFATKSTKRTIRFVEFTNEEPPYFWTKDMGSFVYAKQLHQQGANIVAMLSLETMGYFSDIEKSQRYPFPIGLIYPNQGNFIGFIGNVQSGDLVRKAIASFRNHAQFPSEGASLPDWISGIGWSDHWSFWQQGYPAIMVTDTATYRYPHYHTEQDTLDKINFDKFTRVVTGLTEVIFDLAN